MHFKCIDVFIGPSAHSAAFIFNDVSIGSPYKSSRCLKSIQRSLGTLRNTFVSLYHLLFRPFFLEPPTHTQPKILFHHVQQLTPPLASALQNVSAVTGCVWAEACVCVFPELSHSRRVQLTAQLCLSHTAAQTLFISHTLSLRKVDIKTAVRRDKCVPN